MTTRADATVDAIDGALVFTCARQLRSPNAWQGHHWRVKDEDTRTWQQMMVRAVPLRPAAYALWTQMLYPVGDLDKQPERRRVIVVSLLPSFRHAIRDDDNLRFAVKPLNDALQRMGLIYQDSRRWLEQPMPEQRVSEDKQCWTIVTIGRCKESHAG